MEAISESISSRVVSPVFLERFREIFHASQVSDQSKVHLPSHAAR